jgi:TolB-like protein/Flp pilus assembly protein TadD
MSDVFVSYKTEDRRRVRLLVEALQAEGYSVWWDEQIHGGSAWRHAIEAELNAAKCVIVAWSKHSSGAEGTFVQDEATRAQQRHVYVPVMIDKVHLPLGFGETQALPLISWHGDREDPRYQAVLAAVRRNVGGRRKAVSNSVTAVHANRRTVIVGGSVAAVAVAGAGAWALLKSSSAAASSDSIAVLPFENLSGDPTQAYFSDGVAEEIRSALARISGLKVVGRTSSEAVRKDDAETAAKKLGVANILTGSVRQSPSTIRISAELVDGRNGIDKWSQDYDRSPGDAIKIQTDIAENVASALSAALGTAARAVISVGGTSNPEAQRLFIQAGALGSGRVTRERLEQALKLLDSALALDPNYADAYARKSGTLTTYTNNFAKSAEETARQRAESLRLARIALKVAPDLPRGHRALSSYYGSNLQFARALAELHRAHQLAPGDADILSTLSLLVGNVGDVDEALKINDQAIAADPLNADPYNTRLVILFHGRRYAEAVNYAIQLQRNSPTLFQNHATVGDCLLLLGRSQEAQSYYDDMPADYWWRLTGEAILAIRAGDRIRVQDRLAKLQQANGEAASFQYAEIFAQLGDKDRAFAALDRAYVVKDPGLIATRVDPFLDPLRSDPRFAAMLQKLNFPT